MDELMLVLRLLHVVPGAIWVGMAVFTVFYLTPALQEAGPESAKVMAALQRRGIMTVMPVLGVVTILSGTWLYGRTTLGFRAELVTSSQGLAFGVGGLASLAALIIGLAVMRPAMLRAAALMRSVSGPGGADREQAMAEVGRLRARGGRAGRTVAVLLVLAVIAMAVGRYLPVGPAAE